MKVYLVEDCEMAPGRILAVFADQDDAVTFAEALDISCRVEERTLFVDSAPPILGYNE
jgi:hypothetical protein